MDQRRRLHRRPAERVQHRTRGNALFPAAAIVAHEKARAETIAFGPARELPFWQNPDWGDLPPEPPFLTFTDEIALHAGGTRITARHAGTAAHTTNDVLAWVPDKSVLSCGTSCSTAACVPAARPGGPRVIRQ